ncbi:glycosyltransferase family 69 protein [Cercospora zeae-maydis SCOH1-5]|uniref:Glycosyltransferase family 69 protein n=1 Tax=Cercospora zeae-maydis SCOH1-5 TaxID=717836 RepID=A0A6A6FI25_9PEZI|nr:glycosyltransferase family 69 protein [Cercospora zeae-maydis SCOH1-5]
MQPRRRKDSGLLGRFQPAKPSAARRRRDGSESAPKRYAKYVAILLLAWTVIEVLLVKNAISREAATKSPALGGEKIFVTSIHWTSEKMLRYNWIPQVVELTKAIGRENVFLSVYESGSLDDSKGALRELDAHLETAGISRKIVLENTTHLEEMEKRPPVGVKKDGWIQTPETEGKMELRRIPYLAKLRNLALEPLFELHDKGLKFDKVLFLNDVVFDNHDVQTLLHTNEGEYGAACSLDFSKPPSIYDTFALRDIDGKEPLMQTWPFFGNRKSRKAVKNSKPVRVKSCWNGMVAIPAEAFYGGYRSLKFRALPDSLADSHLEASECCLIHADSPFSTWKGVYLNPNVRVGYKPDAYVVVHRAAWVSTFRAVHGIWTNRVLRWTSWISHQTSTIHQRIAEWKAASEMHFESGDFCVIDEMQVIYEFGWAHV